MVTFVQFDFQFKMHIFSVLNVLIWTVVVNDHLSSEMTSLFTTGIFQSCWCFFMHYERTCLWVLHLRPVTFAC